MAFNWTLDKEEELVQLRKLVPALYDPGCRMYSNRNEREKALKEISVNLGTTSKEVDTRMRSIRTQYSRLAKPDPSGSGAKEVTLKQAWLQKNCSFLSPHVKKRISQSNLNMNPDLDDSRSSLDGENGPQNTQDSKINHPDDTETDTEQETSINTDQGVSKANTSQFDESKKRKSTKRKIEETELELLNSMSNAMTSFQQRKQQKEDDADIFAKNIANKLRKITDSRMRSMLEFEIESLCFKASMGGLDQHFQQNTSQGQSIYNQSTSQQSWNQAYDYSASGDQVRTYAQL